MRHAVLIAGCISRPICMYRAQPSGQRERGATFEIANRGRKGLLGRFNRNAARSNDPSTLG